MKADCGRARQEPHLVQRAVWTEEALSASWETLSSKTKQSRTLSDMRGKRLLNLWVIILNETKSWWFSFMVLVLFLMLWIILMFNQQADSKNPSKTHWPCLFLHTHCTRNKLCESLIIPPCVPHTHSHTLTLLMSSSCPAFIFNVWAKADTKFVEISEVYSKYVPNYNKSYLYTLKVTHHWLMLQY